MNDLRIAVYDNLLADVSIDNFCILYDCEIDSLWCFGGSTHLKRETDKTQWLMNNIVRRKNI